MAAAAAAAAAASNGSNNFKTICGKDDMLLRKNTDMKLFSLEYFYKNNNFDLTTLINVKLHDLLYEVNKDIFESIDIQPLSTDPGNMDYNILYIFKDIGGDLGGFKTYMYVATKIHRRFAGNGTTEINFTSKSIPYDYHSQMIERKYKLVEYPLYIQKYVLLSPNNIQVIHMFKLKPENEADMTVTVENSISIVIKKMYLRLKYAVEHLNGV
jgi:hypothetical protein